MIILYHFPSLFALLYLAPFSLSSCGSVFFGLALVFWLKEGSRQFHCLQLVWFQTTNQAVLMVLPASLRRVTTSLCDDACQGLRWVWSLLPIGGAFMAGWPFSRLVEGTSWKVAYQLLVLASGAMVAISSYFMMLLLKGLPSRTTRKFD